MTVERHETEVRRSDFDGPDRPVPGTGNADGELVADLQDALLAANLDEASEGLGGGPVGCGGERAYELASAEIGLADARRSCGA